LVASSAASSCPRRARRLWSEEDGREPILATSQITVIPVIARKAEKADSAAKANRKILDTVMIQTLFRSLLMSAAFVLTGWGADGLTINCVDFQKIEINGRPARMILITSLGATGLLDAEARRLGLKGHETWVEAFRLTVRISESTPVQDAGQNFMAPIPIVRLPWWARLASHFFTIPVDGAVGWPEVRDNILVFDSAARTIRRVEQLPPETAGWMRLKVVPSDCLLLELPLTNGEMGVIWVETSESQSVLIPPTQWKEWKASYPHSARADEIKLGPLTLTDVAVKELSAGDAKVLLNVTPAATALWVLGISALTRLDLVVDGKNGRAYLHPKPPDPPHNPTNTSPSKGDWKVAENVRLSSDNLFVYSGLYKLHKNDFIGALADFNHTLELNPRNFDAYSGRGVIREVLGDYPVAVSNYDQVIKLRPDNSEWERLYRQALLWRLARSPEKDTNPAAGGKVVVLEPVVVYGYRQGRKEHWTKTLALFLDGMMDEKALLAAAKKSDGELPASEQKALASYYIGIMRLSKGDQKGACEWLQKCRAAGFKDDPEYYFSAAELVRMDAVVPR
jgi:lipoprotein NlpI